MLTITINGATGSGKTMLATALQSLLLFVDKGPVVFEDGIPSAKRLAEIKSIYPFALIIITNEV